ncbi:hypothetical protein [Breoghania sp. L-A4]|uniref:hypothetical protein n=1 Tax=Breoghania sp. L-A4 TaxID=2304600 RepID=UPI0013C32318|nr:hypothetical protein [Breoghania sp. L-A4]
MAFLLGNVSNALGVTEKALGLFWAEAPAPPQVVNSYAAFAVGLVERQRVNEIFDSVFIENAVLRQGGPTDEQMRGFVESENRKLAQAGECNIRIESGECASIDYYQLYVVGIMLKNEGGAPIKSSKMVFDRFDLDETFRGISHFSINYTKIENGCLYSFPERPCTLAVGDTKPSKFELKLPELVKGKPIYVPMFLVLVPHSTVETRDWYQFQWGLFLSPRKFIYEYGDGYEGEFVPREMLENVFEIDDFVFGLG